MILAWFAVILMIKEYKLTKLSSLSLGSDLLYTHEM